MPVTNNGVAKFFKGGLVTQTVYLALFVGDVEVSGGGYARQAAAADKWKVSGTKMYLKANLEFPDPTAAWGAVDRAKMMTAPTGGQTLADWDGTEFSLVDASGDAVASIASGDQVAVRGGSADGLSITVPTS